MGKRNTSAFLGVGLLLTIMVRTSLLVSAKESRGLPRSRGLEVASLQDVSDLSDITKADDASIPKESDNLLLVDTRTNFNASSDSAKNNSDTNGSPLAGDDDPAEVPIPTLNTEISRTTNTAESSDERPTPFTTLRVASDGENEVTTLDDIVTFVGDDATIGMDFTTITATDGTISNEEYQTIVADSTDIDEESFLTDTTESSDFLECTTVENECEVLPTDTTESSNGSFFTSPLGNEDKTLPGVIPTDTVIPDFDPDKPELINKDSEDLEVTTMQSEDNSDPQVPLNPPSSVPNEFITVLDDLVGNVTESDTSVTDTEPDTEYITDSDSTYDDEAPQGMVTDVSIFEGMERETGDESDLIVETLISTATVYYDEESLQNLATSRRVLRTVSQDLYASQLDANHVEYRGFLSAIPSSDSAMERHKNVRKSDPEPDIDDIIKGIVQLLGGNVKVTAAEETNTRLTTFGNDHMSSRINNRGPPRVSQAPFGILSTPVLTRPPIRPPVTPPTNPYALPPGRPQFVANTRPPFLAPLPPSLSSRPSPPVQRPYATGFPLPVDLLPNSEEANDGAHVIPVDPVFPDYENYDETGDNTEDITPPLRNSTTGNINSEPADNSTYPEDEISVETISTFTTMPSESESTTLDIKETHIQNTSTISAASTTVPSFSSSVPPESTMEPSSESTSHSSTLDPTSILIAPTPVTTEEPQHFATITTSELSSQASPTSYETSNNNQFSSTATPPLQPVPSLLPSVTPPTFMPSSSSPSSPSFTRPRPGVVLDDSDYRPGQIITGAVVPFDFGRPGETFDVTVSAYQDFGGARPAARPPSNPNVGQPYIIAENPYGNDGSTGPLITTPAGDDGFVSIDGRKTYFDLFPTATESLGLTQSQTAGTGVGIVIPEEDIMGQGSHGGFYEVKPLPQPPTTGGSVPTQPPTPSPTQSSTRPKPLVRKPSYNRRPTQPPIRIDTCIVGDDSTCQEQLNEVCRTEEGVSSCYCRPGTARRRPRTPCKRMISLKMSMKVDRVGDQRIVWGGNYGNPESEEYRLLEWESKQAISNAMSKTRLSSAYLGNTIHKFYSLGGRVIVNSTIYFEDTPTTRSRNIPQNLQRQMIQVIQSHANNIGDSALYVDGPLNPIPDVSDVNECNDPSLYDCHPDATCINEFGTFTCRCLPGYTDRFSDDPAQVGRKCESCSSDYCNKRGDCRIEAGQKVCECKGSYYGTRCEIDGEVLGVAVGASVAAVVIIILTLIFLCMWSRRWKAQDRKTEVLARGAAAAGAAFGGGFAVNVQHKGGGSLQPSQYGVSMEDRMRWAQIAESITNQNIYAHQSQDSGAVYSANSNEYLTSASTSNPYSVYNRVTRAISNSTIGRGGRGHGSLVDRLRRLVGWTSKTKSKKNGRVPSYMMTSHPTLNFQQLMALHAHLSGQPENLRGTLAGPSAPPTISATTPTPLFKSPRQMAGSSSGYASLGTLGSTATGQFSHQQFGMQHLNPLATLQQQQQHYQQQQQSFGAQSTYGQYGPASFSAMSQSGAGGVSRAPTLGARTPIPLHESMGAATIGPMGGASVAAAGMGTTRATSMGMMESSEEEMDRPYQLPRPKSRGSLADGSDIYYEPDDLTTTYGPPDRPPPPIPKNSHPQTYNLSFLH